MLVDDDDFLLLKDYKWNHMARGYAARYVGSPSKAILAHREICKFPNKEVDHINGNKLDNRKNNLRICNRRTNATNSGKRYPRGKYGRNVAKMNGTRTKPYLVQCWYYGRPVFGGYFATIEEAQKVAARLRRKLDYVK